MPVIVSHHYSEELYSGKQTVTLNPSGFDSEAWNRLVVASDRAMVYLIVLEQGESLF